MKTKKNIVAVSTVSFLLVSVMALIGPLTLDAKLIVNPNEFSKEFFKKLEEGADEEDLISLVRKAKPVINPVVMAIARRGIVSLSKGKTKEAKVDFLIAGWISKIYAFEFNEDALFNLVMRYAQYSSKMAQEKLKGDALTGDGYSLGEKIHWEEAKQKLTEAHEIYANISDDAGVSATLMGLGKSYFWLAQYQDAKEYALQSLALSRKLGNWQLEAENLINIGNIYLILGRYSEALTNFHQTEDIYRKLEDRSARGEVLLNIGNVYFYLGHFAEASEWYQESLGVFRETGHAAQEAESLMNIGNTHLRRGQLLEATNAYSTALNISRKISDVPLEARILLNIGSIYILSDAYKSALENFQQALEVFRRIDDHNGETAALVNIGVIHTQLGQYDKAVRVLRESLIKAEKHGRLEAVWRAHSSIGKVLWNSNKSEEAVQSYEQAVKTIDKIYMRSGDLKEEERSQLIGKKRFVYQDYLDLLIGLHTKNPAKGYDRKAFRVSEQAKSRTFQELLAKAGARTVFAGDTSFQQMLETERLLLVKVTQFRQRLSTEKREKELKLIQEKLAKAELSLRHHQQLMDEQFPQYADLKRPKHLTIEETQRSLLPTETLVAYAVGEERGAAFVIAKDRFKLVELPIRRKELTKLIKQFRQGLDNVSDMEDLRQFDPKIAYTLYQNITHPIVKDLQGATRFYLSADDVLYTVPFGALVDRAFDPQPFEKTTTEQGVYLGEYATLHYLIDTYSITYLPFASVLRSLRQYEKPGFGRWRKQLIAFADPIFGEEESKIANGGSVKDKKSVGVMEQGLKTETALTTAPLRRATGRDSLPRLEDSAEEARAICREVRCNKNDLYLREHAMEENVYRTDLKSVRYLLFSTHGLLGGDFSGLAEPALALTMVGNPPGHDGFLTMGEVLGLDLNAELIILSACNTYGKGEKAGRGEGFAGLTRSFMYAGTKSLLITHWSVESKAARDLMVDMFRLKRKQTTPEALRQAKIKMKNSTRPYGDDPSGKLSLAHPFFWAPFVLVGEGI